MTYILKRVKRKTPPFYALAKAKSYFYFNNRSANSLIDLIL